MVALDFFWRQDKQYLVYDKHEMGLVPKPDAPKEVLDSYNHYLKQLEYYREKERKTGAHII